MLKVLVIIALMMIDNFWAAGLSCSSCGSECVTACGTRRFRICCFNHLRRKRGPELIQIQNVSPDGEEDFVANDVFVSGVPEQWLNNLVSRAPSLHSRIKGTK